MIVHVRIAYMRFQERPHGHLMDILTHNPEAIGHKDMAEVFGPKGRCELPMWWCAI